MMKPKIEIICSEDLRHHLDIITTIADECLPKLIAVSSNLEIKVAITTVKSEAEYKDAAGPWSVIGSQTNCLIAVTVMSDPGAERISEYLLQGFLQALRKYKAASN